MSNHDISLKNNDIKTVFSYLVKYEIASNQILETLRIFTRYGGTIYHNIGIEEKAQTAKP